jgi:hypothetical protein
MNPCHMIKMRMKFEVKVFLLQVLNPLIYLDNQWIVIWQWFRSIASYSIQPFIIIDTPFHYILPFPLIKCTYISSWNGKYERGSLYSFLLRFLLSYQPRFFQEQLHHPQIYFQALSSFCSTCHPHPYPRIVVRGFVPLRRKKNWYFSNSVLLIIGTVCSLADNFIFLKLKLVSNTYTH